jgi:hypothetical protein
MAKALSVVATPMWRDYLSGYLRGYLDDNLIQSSWARTFSAFQLTSATSQFTMVRLGCAT